MASTPARPLMDGMIEMLQTMAKKDTIWESALKEMESQYTNLQKLGTKAFNDSISLPMDLSKEEWKELKNYALADEMQSLPIPIFILFGRDDISLSQKEFDTWKIKLANLNPFVNNTRSYPCCLLPLMIAMKRINPATYLYM